MRGSCEPFRATVGELDKNALFYLGSRGVLPGEARALLTQAFVADALDRIGDEAVLEAARGDVPQTQGRVLPSAGKHLAIGAEGDGPDPLPVPVEHPGGLGFQVP